MLETFTYTPIYWNNTSWTHHCDVSIPKPSDVSCISSSLQEDLEMSDSDDEIEVISEVKSNDAKNNVDNSAAEYPKSSPLNSSGVTSVISSTAVNNSTMDVPQSVPSSSSSESGDSDSDDSSSESNDSDSSASSEASDADTPSKMWGLSNFFDETRRNHSPAFVPMDTSTNSSTTAIKEEPVAVRQDPRESYSLVDDDSVNGGLRDHITDPIPNFLELDSSVNIKREILSPITSPLHQAGPSSLQLPPPPPPPPPPPAPNPQTIRGPRTPPSPEYSVTVESVDINRNSVSSGNVKSDNAINVEITVPQSQTIKHSGIQQISCDMKEETGKVQTTIVKKRLSKNKTEIFSPRTDSSPVTQSFEDDEPSASKGLPDVSSDKDENGIDVLTSSYSVPSETSESSHDNYSIKTRQKVSKSSSTKKTKAVIEEVPNLNCQKGNNLSKSSGSKTKHPVRTCRTSSDAKQLSKTVKSSKSDQSEETKRPIVKPDLKEKSSSEKNKNSSRSGSNAKAVSKNSVKIKKKPSKLPPKPATDGKKDEVKKKKSKFHIQNFLQSPTVSQSESLILKVSVHSPSCDRSPIPDYKKSAEKRKRSISPTCGSRSPSRSSSKSIDRVKCEKLRRSTRCSERASSIAQAESSTATNQDSDVAKKSSKRTPKRREHVESSPVHVEAPPLLLSPIPHNSPIPVTLSECAIPTKILVSIPLDKISRLPSSVRVLSSEIKPISKRSQQPVDENIQKKDSVLSEKSSKNTSSKYSSSKDIKYKPRTDLDSKASKNSKSALVSKKDKNSKALSESSSVKTKTTSSVNSKNSIKTAENKQSSGASENKVSKKRKSEGEIKQPVKKKSKTYLEVNQDRSQLPSARTESPNNLIACTSKSKGLERCDSVSSLSSLGSQVSQRSSKEKRNSSASEAKREKLSVPLKHVIKQEKEEKVKATIKKEPGTPDKNKDVGRDKLLSKDADCSEKKVETTWNDTSSQYSPWEDSCKDDSKGLPIPTPLSDSMNRICALEWDSLEMKNVKEASNLKHANLPIMPMDYYYMEGRKQRHLAEKEKDPFVQTLKFFEATVLFILTSQQREEYTKEPESVYQFYRETLNFSNLILENVRLQQCSPGSMEFKVLVLLLRCQALLHVKLYNLKLKEIKEQQKHVSEFFLGHCQATVQSLTHPIPSNPRMNLISIPSPHSPAPSPASSVNSQTSGYSSSDVSSCHRNLSHFAPSVTIARNMLETICRQHTHLTNLHMGHDLWEQADMYMTRSNLREFFKEVADLSENLTLHSSIKDLVNYVQTGISLVKKCCR